MGKIVRNSVTTQIYEYIVDMIQKKKWKVGEKIPSENVLAEELGVSSMSVRSAIQKTNAVGLTETHVGEGTFVKEFSMKSYFESLIDMDLFPSDYREINDFRSILQMGSMILAILEDKIDEKDIGLLMDMKEGMEKAIEKGEKKKYFDIDFQYHQYICNLCNNRIVEILYHSLSEVIKKSEEKNYKISMEYNGNGEKIKEYHSELLEGIKNRDIQKCVQAEGAGIKRNHIYYE